VRLRPETLQLIVDEIAGYGIAPGTSEVIVRAVIDWYEDMRKVRMRMSTSGQKIGRPRTMTSHQVAEARRLRATGLSFRAIGDCLGVKGRTVWYELLPPKVRVVKMKKLRVNVDKWRAAREIAV